MLKIKEFVDQVIKEASKISWSSRKETSVSMMLVVAMVIIASLFFLLVDVGTYKVVQLLLNLGVNSSDL
jgi:preprotein translocase subunit SecE